MKKTILLNIIKIAVIISFFTPLIVHSGYIFPFVFPKTAVFQVLVEIIFFAWLILIIEHPEYRPVRTKIFLAISFFLAILFFASLFGVDFPHSFWSNYERMTGLITLFHYFAYFLVLTSVLKTKKDWFLIFDSFIIASIVISLYAIGQKFGIESFLSAGQNRLSANFGNASYFAAYLIFVVFMAAFMFFQRQSRWAKTFYAFAFLLNFSVLYWTQTRGALLGFAFAALVFFLTVMFWPAESKENERFNKFRKRLKLVSLILLAFLVLFSSVVYLSRDQKWVKKSETLRRLTSISMKEDSSQTRLLAWRMSYKGFLEKPILGWGWENYNIVFNKYYDPHMFPVENWFDRAHNFVFDMLVAGGVAGLLSYLGIFGTVYWVLWKALRKKIIDVLNAALFASLIIAYLVQNLFIFDMLHSYLPLFTILAFMNWVEQKEKFSNGQKSTLPKAFNPNVFLWTILCVVFVMILYSVNIKPGLASAQAINTMKEQQKGAENMLDNFKKSLSYGTFGRFEIRLQIFDVAGKILSNYNAYQDKASIDKLVNFAIEEGEKTVKERPLDARYLLAVGQLNINASLNDPKRLNRAVEILEKAKKESPNKQIILFTLGEAKLRQGSIEEGLKLFQTAVDINDKAQESHLNLATVYLMLGELEQGQKIIESIEQKFGPLSSPQYKRISDIMDQQKRYPQAAFYIQKAIDVDRVNGQLYAALASIYLKMGEKEKAKETAIKAMGVDSSLQKEMEEFIQSIDKKEESQ